jgi:predicted PurR-regulated permease PerM
MSINRIVEYVFFFLILATSGYLLWQVFSPFVSALALSMIIVTISYPLYEFIERHVYHNNRSLASALTTVIVVIVGIMPLVFISTVFIRELVSFYQNLGNGQELSIDYYLGTVENTIKIYVPEFQLNLTEQLRQSAEWFVLNLGSIFAGTITTIFLIFISLIGSFYFFRDGKDLLKFIIKISPLPDSEDQIILSRLAKSMRAVTVGVVLVSLIQGVLAAIGFSMFGIDRAVLWGAVAAILAMLPGVGTSAIMIPAIIYLFFKGVVVSAVGLLVWGIMMFIFVDNILGPHLMSRGHSMHPFLILLSVLGGISMFGPIGFIVGPVIVTLFIVLLEIYDQYIVKDGKKVKK